jgi:hypothetical protein
MRAWMAVVACAAGCRGFFNTPAVGEDAAIGPDATHAIDAAADAGADAPFAKLRYQQGNLSLTMANTAGVPFTGGQQTGDTIVVGVSWGTLPNTVESVTDSAGNSYRGVIGPQEIGTSLGQQMFVAADILPMLAGGNTVTVQLSSTAQMTVAIAEYSGLAPTEILDATAGGTGTGGSLDAGVIHTGHPHDLVIAFANSSNSTAISDLPDFQTRLSSSVTFFSDLEVDQLQDTDLGTSVIPGSSSWVLEQIALCADD